ncbi:MAG: hypothetical protein OXU20_22170 [Myxococcales bacterium]|nr:hypothetical protein [Myxococcales bacterium]
MEPQRAKPCAVTSLSLATKVAIVALSFLCVGCEREELKFVPPTGGMGGVNEATGGLEDGGGGQAGGKRADRASMGGGASSDHITDTRPPSASASAMRAAGPGPERRGSEGRNGRSNGTMEGTAGSGAAGSGAAHGSGGAMSTVDPGGGASSSDAEGVPGSEAEEHRSVGSRQDRDSSDPRQDEGHEDKGSVDGRARRPGDGVAQPGCQAEELCGNDLDDDCDGTVDESALLGQPCRITCPDRSEAPGFYMCDHDEQHVACKPERPSDCVEMVPSVLRQCGNGVKEAGESCDYMAPNLEAPHVEQLGVTCSRDCTPIRFPRCVFGFYRPREPVCQGSNPVVCHSELLDVRPEVCPRLTRCVTQAGACLPFLSATQPRCPTAPQEPPLYCGNGRLDEGEECEPRHIAKPDVDCAWNCREVPIGEEIGAPDYRPALRMTEVPGETGVPGQPDQGSTNCLVSCADASECPASIPECYMGVCVAPV